MVSVVEGAVVVASVEVVAAAAAADVVETAAAAVDVTPVLKLGEFCRFGMIPSG